MDFTSSSSLDRKEVEIIVLVDNRYPLNRRRKEGCFEAGLKVRTDGKYKATFKRSKYL